jgi:hypothetical protein
MIETTGSIPRLELFEIISDLGEAGYYGNQTGGIE